MENVKILKILVFSIALSNIINLTIRSQVYAYEVQTHEGITKEIVAFYNLYFSDKPISDIEAEQMIAGANLEDDAPRWLNHYYDPIHNKGLDSPLVAGEWLSSKAWSRNKSAQTAILFNPMKNTTVALYAMISDPEALEMTDYTWERAIKDYIKGDKERAFRGLGQALHLIEDASVPDHTRNDPHIAIGGHGIGGEGSPYELWTHQFNRQNTNLLQYLYLKKPIILGTLDEYFDGMANYSNRNFYSKDTIVGGDFLEPTSDYFVKVGKRFYGYKRDGENGDYRLLMYYNDPTKNIWSSERDKSAVLQDEQLLRDYWERLAPKAVQYGAGVVNLFFKEVERLKDDPEFNKPPEKSLMGQIIDTVKGWFPEDNDGFQGIAEVSLDNGESLMVKGGSGGLANKNLGSPSTRSGTKEITNSGSPSIRPERPYSGTNDFNNEDEELAQNDNVELPISNNPMPTGRQELSNESKGSPSINLGTNVFLNQGSPSTSSGTNDEISPQVCVYDVQANPTRTGVIINEVAWAGTENNPADEWIELKNITQSNLDISNWQLIDKEDQIHVTFETDIKVPAGGYFLFERTDDESVPGIAADYIYVGALSNNDEGLRLFDNHCVLIDEVIANTDWPAGSSNPRRSMERASDLSWRTYSGSTWLTTGGEVVVGVYGTPKAENTQGASSANQNSQLPIPSAEQGSNPSTTTPAEAPAGDAGVVALGHVLISEVMAGSDGNNENEFVELYNPTDATINLIGYSLKKKNSSGTENNLVSSGAFAGSIAPKSFFLIAHENYAGAKPKDLVYSANSQNLAYTNNAAVLYDAGGAKVDEMSWGEIKKGESWERKAFSLGSCVSAQGTGEFSGNGCDTDIATDFETRAVPNPQNKSSLPEPRDKPTAVSGFNINYDKATLSVAFSWDYSTAAGTTSTSSVVYVLKDVSDTAVPIELVSLSLSSYSYKIKEINRNYKYSIIAKDIDGLAGDEAQKELSVPSFWKSFLANSENGIMEIEFDAYPFIPTVAGGEPLWKLVVFSRSSAPISQVNINNTTSWAPDALVDLIKYKNYAGEVGKYSLMLTDDADHFGAGGGPASASLAWGEIEDNRIRVNNDILKTLGDAAGEYIVASFYDYIGSGSEVFNFIATDVNKYLVSSEAPENLLPTAPVNVLVETLLPDGRAIFSFSKSSDSDGLDRNITYEINAAKVIDGDSDFDEDGWVYASEVGYAGSEPDHEKRYHTFWRLEDGGEYVFGARAKDERGGVSEVAKSEGYLVP